MRILVETYRSSNLGGGLVEGVESRGRSGKEGDGGGELHVVCCRWFSIAVVIEFMNLSDGCETKTILMAAEAVEKSSSCIRVTRYTLLHSSE